MNNKVYNYLFEIYNLCKPHTGEDFGRAFAQLKTYESLLKNWSYRFNLVSPGDVDNLWIKHFVPSLKPLEVGLIPGNIRMLDAGSGAGFPGIPLKIFRDDLILTLCDSRRKRALFLQEVVETLELSGVSVHSGRFEDIKESFDLVVSRAVGKPAEVAEGLLGKTVEGGRVLLWTAKSQRLEIEGLKTQSWGLESAGQLLLIESNPEPQKRTVK